MNDLGWIVLGLAARATALSAFGLLLVVALRRRGPSAGALAGSTTMAVLVGVAALAFSPWPRWWSTIGLDRARPVAIGADSVHQARPEVEPRAAIGPARSTIEVPGGWTEFFVEVQRRLAEPRESDRASGWRWTAWAACAFLAGLAVALVRLGLGLWAVRTLRRDSRPVDDPRMLGLVDSLGSELGLCRGVELRESSELATPATIGWRSPVVLLPGRWTGWEDVERRAVLAHELAHVLRGDYLAGLVTQVGLSLHFYHPMVHALARRVRLEQELAADAWGARLSGGRQVYLMTLANLALRQPPKATTWPARPFLPARGTFLRRIEMLRDPNAWPVEPVRPRGRALIVASLTLLGLAVAGLRGPAGSSPTLAQEPPKPKAAPPTPYASIEFVGAFLAQPFDAASAGPTVRAVLDVRPSAFFGRPEWKPLAEALDGMVLIPGGLPLAEVEQYLLLGIDRQPPPPGTPSHAVNNFAWVVRATHPHDWKGYMARDAEEIKPVGEFSRFAGYRKGNGAGLPIYFRQLDDRTFLAGSIEDITNPPIGVATAVAHDWDDALKQVGDRPLRLAVGTNWLARQLEPLAPRGADSSLMPTAFRPLLDQAKAYAMGLAVQDGLALDAVGTSTNEADAGRVADTVRAALTLARNALPDLRKGVENSVPGSPTAAIRPLVDAFGPLAEGAKVELDGKTVRLRSRAAINPVSAASTLLMPAVMASREAERREACTKNMKRIGLALHNYCDQNGAFPPASVLGPDGKTPHSWRVAILPFLEGEGFKELHAQYKFDEPWDGPNNFKLLAKMPQVYAHPGDGESSTFAAYFVPVGGSTMFRSSGEGVKINAITDGMNTTIMLVEARKVVPWTKPEDMEMDRMGIFRSLGGFHPGGFNVAFADGSVRFLKDSIDKTVLSGLFTPNGGVVIQTPQAKD